MRHVWTLILVGALASAIGCGDDDATPPGTDAGRRDSGSTATDSGSPPRDSGTPAVDSGTPAVDAGTPATDAGTPAGDAGTPASDAGGRDAGAPMDAGSPSDAGAPSDAGVPTDAPRLPVDAGAFTTADWSTTATDHDCDDPGVVGSWFSYSCPAGGTEASVWGTDVYTNDSRVCTAAVHAGLITLATGGVVTIEMRAGAASYTGSTRNGITSMSYGSWFCAYVFP